MGTRAHWLSGPWRYAALDEDGDPIQWIYADALRDVMSDIEDTTRWVRIQKRTGRKSEGYTYVNHSIYEPKEAAPMFRRSVTVTLDTEAAALRTEDGSLNRSEVGFLLSIVAHRIGEGDDDGQIRDTNGVHVGSFTVAEKKS